MTPLEYVNREQKKAQINLENAVRRKDQSAIAALLEKIGVLKVLEFLCTEHERKSLM